MYDPSEDYADFCPTDPTKLSDGHGKKRTRERKKGIYTQEDCNNFIADAISLNKARFPVSDITHYTPTRDLSDF